MGFIVNPSGLVSVDHSINDFAETTLFRNPASATTKSHPKMTVHSAFIRRARKQASKTKGSAQVIGDNCPFIYAVKGKIPGLHINTQTIRDLVNPLNEILNKFIEQQAQNNVSYDLIVPMPSSHRISDILATRLSRKAKVTMNTSIFRKSTADDVTDMVNTDRDIPHNAKLNIIAAINLAKQEGKSFSLGDVKTDYRHYIRPLSLHGRIPVCEKVLLVDDLFASGRTLITARDELLSAKPGLRIDAFCLFSPLNNRIRSV